MMVRFRMVAVMVVVGVALGGCAEQSSPPPEPRSQAATPEATQHEATEAPSAGERALALANERSQERVAERTGGPRRERGDPGWMSDSIRGSVTRAAHNTNGHWITVEKDPDAYCRTMSKIRRTRCARWGLKVLDDTVVLRGEGDDARPATPSDVEEGQRVHAFPSDSIAPEYPPAAGADKIVILRPD